MLSRSRERGHFCGLPTPTLISKTSGVSRERCRLRLPQIGSGLLIMPWRLLARAMPASPPPLRPQLTHPTIHPHTHCCSCVPPGRLLISELLIHFTAHVKNGGERRREPRCGAPLAHWGTGSRAERCQSTPPRLPLTPPGAAAAATATASVPPPFPPLRSQRQLQDPPQPHPPVFAYVLGSTGNAPQETTESPRSHYRKKEGGGRGVFKRQA